MTTEDQILCESVLSSGHDVGQKSWIRLVRNGSLLLALPYARNLALCTLDLYQPQKIQGRWLKYLMQCIVRLNLHRLLPKCTFKLGDKGLLSVLKEHLGVDAMGMMLSSPVSNERNVIGVIEVNDRLCVVKAGVGKSSNSVKREYKVTKDVGGVIGEVPKVVVGFTIVDGYAYVSEMVGGISPQSKSDEVRVFTTLTEWLSHGATMPISKTEHWCVLYTHGVNNSNLSKVMRRLEGVEICSPIVHGDFAPWNVKLSKSELFVLDWESAVMNGVPGWDAFHYIVQKSLLVDGMDANEVYQICLSWVQTDIAKQYFLKAGLSGYEVDILAIYLYYSSEVEGYDRQGLIDAWLKGESH